MNAWRGCAMEMGVMGQIYNRKWFITKGSLEGIVRNEIFIHLLGFGGPEKIKQKNELEKRKF